MYELNIKVCYRYRVKIVWFQQKLVKYTCTGTGLCKQGVGHYVPILIYVHFELFLFLSTNFINCVKKHRVFKKLEIF